MDFCVVVKINEQIARPGFCLGGDEFCIIGLLSFAPKFQSRCPPIQGAVAVAAGIQLGITVEAAVDKISRQILSVGPLTSGICKNEGNVEFAQEFEKIRHKESRVTNFDTVTQ